MQQDVILEHSGTNRHSWYLILESLSPETNLISDLNRLISSYATDLSTILCNFIDGTKIESIRGYKYAYAQDDTYILIDKYTIQVAYDDNEYTIIFEQPYTVYAAI